MKKPRIKVLLLLSLFLLVLSPGVHAQDDGPDGPPPASPIDKTTPLLVIAGVALAYRMFQKKLSNKI